MNGSKQLKMPSAFINDVGLLLTSNPVNVHPFPPCELHLFVCANDRDPATGMPCCARAGGEDVYHAFKDRVARLGLTSRVWVTKTACLGFCNKDGTTIAAYPSGRILTAVKVEDVSKILKES